MFSILFVEWSPNYVSIKVNLAFSSIDIAKAGHRSTKNDSMNRQCRFLPSFFTDHLTTSVPAHHFLNRSFDNVGSSPSFFNRSFDKVGSSPSFFNTSFDYVGFSPSFLTDHSTMLAPAIFQVEMKCSKNRQWLSCFWSDFYEKVHSKAYVLTDFRS